MRTFLIILLVLVLILKIFYRDPDLTLPSQEIDDAVILSPAQGTIHKIYKKNGHLNIWIYLNIFNIHTQYVPVSGTVTRTNHLSGTFHPAYMFVKSQYNERLATTIQTRNFDDVIVTQVAGQIARNIINYTERGQEVHQGKRLGRILLGSSVIVSIPERVTSGVNILIKEGDKIEINDCLVKSK